VENVFFFFNSYTSILTHSLTVFLLSVCCHVFKRYKFRILCIFALGKCVWPVWDVIRSHIGDFTFHTSQPMAIFCSARVQASRIVIRFQDENFIRITACSLSALSKQQSHSTWIKYAENITSVLSTVYMYTIILCETVWIICGKMWNNSYKRLEKLFSSFIVENIQ